MSTVNIAEREIVAKIVYYGPALSGKTTSLQRVYRSVSPKYRGDLVSLATSGDRTIFFDFLPIKVDQINGFSVRLQLYTVPGQVFYNATRKVVLMGADGVVFVADSRPDAMDGNVESLTNLRDNLAEHGIDVSKLPMVLQYNKRDLDGVLEVADLDKKLNPAALPALPSSAKSGEGVVEALRTITRLVARELKARGMSKAKAAAPETKFVPGESLGTAVSALEVPAVPEPSPEATPAASASNLTVLPGLSVQKLFPDGEIRHLVRTLEASIANHDYSAAIRTAGALIRIMLSAMPGADEATRALYLGLHPSDYMRVIKLIREPGAADEEDALFALYVCVAAQIRSEQLP